VSGLKYTDHGVMCDRDDCWTALWGSSMGLRDGMTLTHVRIRAGYRGWRSEKVPPQKMDSYSSRVLDFCPAHAGHEGNFLLLA
jgi:hypothetical protein